MRDLRGGGLHWLTRSQLPGVLDLRTRRPRTGSSAPRHSWPRYCTGRDIRKAHGRRLPLGSRTRRPRGGGDPRCIRCSDGPGHPLECLEDRRARAFGNLLHGFGTAVGLQIRLGDRGREPTQLRAVLLRGRLRHSVYMRSRSRPGTSAPLVVALLEQIRAAVYARRAMHPDAAPVVFTLDEAANIAPLPHFPRWRQKVAVRGS